MTKVDNLHELPKLLKSYALDKLGQLPTDKCAKWTKIARKKYHTTQVVNELLKINSPLKKQYIRVLKCGSQVIERGGIFKTELCRSRVCIYCNNIRTANLINGYSEQVNKQIKDKKAYFLTLTRQTVPPEKLRATIQEMIKNYSNLIRVLNEKRKWGLSGIRAIEITYRKNNNHYHPHIHAIIWGDNLPNDWQEVLIQEWQKRYNTKIVSKKAQDIKRADEGSIKELFKYFTKMSMSATRNNTELQFYPEAIDTALRAITKLRTIQPFGKLKKVSIPEQPSIIVEKAHTIRDIVWNWHIHDWIYIDDNGYYHYFTGYNPPHTYRAMDIPIRDNIPEIHLN